MVRLRIRPGLREIERSLYQQVSREINEALADGAVELAEISPRGVSPYPISLAGSWEVRPIRLLENNKGTIQNTADDALRRMVGVPKGTFVDPVRGDPLFRWALSKGLAARAVSKSILNQGSLRWRTGDNPLDLDFKGDWRYPNHGIAGRITQDIRRRIVRLRF